MDNNKETLPPPVQEDVIFASEDAEGNNKDSEAKKKIPYPKHSFFILGNELCERYSFYGMRGILSLYLTEKLLYSKEDATTIYHMFIFLAYFMPLFGSILSDQFLGKFNTIVSLSMVYVVGHIIKTVGSVTSYDMPHRELCIIGLVIIAIGTGGIKPCVAAFAGDQFVLPGQERQLQSFFSIFYMSINLGSVISLGAGPALKELPCLGEDDCYPLAYGVPAVLMIIATVFIVMGKPFYTMRPSDGIVTKSLCVIWKGLTNLCKKDKSQHWLDPAKEKYGEDLVNDIKFLLGCNGILVLFLPLTVFWAIFDQGGSTWVFQANEMDGTLGSVNIIPDQMQFVNPLLILILVPIFDRLIYPCLAKWKILVKPLQRMTTGLYIAAVAFCISGILELSIQNNPVGSIHMLWQIPQTFLITVAEILISITGLEFAYMQAPSSMSSVIMAFWLLTVAGGSAIATVQTLVFPIEDRAHHIFVFTGLAGVCAIIFTIMALRFVPRKARAEDKDDVQN